MALEATHIRFALDVQERLEVRDVAAYLSGTIYPDSRYVSGIDRNLTHPKVLFEIKHRELSDFEKGWLVHLVADHVQFDITMQFFPEIKAMEEGQGNARWTNHTALKMLQDVEDAKQVSFANYLSCFSYVENPNGESIEKVKEYNSLFPILYAQPESLSLDNYTFMWERFNIGSELTEALKVAAEKYQKDESVKERVARIYPQMVEDSGRYLPANFLRAVGESA